MQRLTKKLYNQRIRSWLCVSKEILTVSYLAESRRKWNFFSFFFIIESLHSKNFAPCSFVASRCVMFFNFITVSRPSGITHLVLIIVVSCLLFPFNPNETAVNLSWELRKRDTGRPARGVNLQWISQNGINIQETLHAKVFNSVNRNIIPY